MNEFQCDIVCSSELSGIVEMSVQQFALSYAENNDTEIQTIQGKKIGFLQGEFIQTFIIPFVLGVTTGVIANLITNLISDMKTKGYSGKYRIESGGESTIVTADNPKEFNEKLKPFLRNQKKVTIYLVDEKDEGAITPALYLLYCGKDIPAANWIEQRVKQLSNSSIMVDKCQDMKCNTIKSKIKKSNHDHNCILCIISDCFFKSKGVCHLGELLYNQDYAKKIMFVTIGDCDRKYYFKLQNSFFPVKVHEDFEKKKQEVIDYWKGEFDQKKQSIQNTEGSELIQSIADELSDIEHIIKKDITMVMDYLKVHECRNLTHIDCECLFEIMHYFNPDYDGGLFVDSMNYSDLLRTGLQIIQKCTGADYNQIALRIQSNINDYNYVICAEDKKNYKKTRIMSSDSVVGKACKSNSCYNIGDIHTWPGRVIVPAAIQSVLAIPITIKNNVVGAIYSESREINHYDDMMLRTLKNVVMQISTCLLKLGVDMGIDKEKSPYVCL